MQLNALWWWIDRWRKSTAYMDMTLEEQGAYRNLIDEATLRGGPLPTDERILAKACGEPLASRTAGGDGALCQTRRRLAQRNSRLSDSPVHQARASATVVSTAPR